MGLIIDSGNILIVADTQSSEVLVVHLPGDVHRLDVVISPWGLAPSSWKVDTQLWQTQKLVYTNLSDADYCSANSSITIRLADIKIIRTLPDFLQIHLLVYVIAFLLFLFKMFSQTLEHKYSNYFTQIFSRRDFLLLIPWLRHSGHLQLRSGR